MYCTVDDLKLRLKFSALKPNTDGTIPLSDPDLQEIIDGADTELTTDMSPVVDFSKVPAATDTPPTPGPIRTASIYKACQFLLVMIHGAQRQVDTITDVQYWEKAYKAALNLVLDMNVPLSYVNSSGVVVNCYKGGASFENTDTSKPAFGDTKYGNYIGPPDYTDGFPETIQGVPASGGGHPS